MSATLEMEAYSMKTGCMVASVQGEDEVEGESTVVVVGGRDSLAAVMERLTARLERLESECPSQQTPYKQYGGHPAYSGGRGMGPSRARSQFQGKCWQCGTPGHLARDCPQSRPP